MSDNIINGQFSLGLTSLKAQVETLLENSGGRQVSELLDTLAELNNSEQDIVLAVFTKLASKLAEGDIRVSDSETQELKELEDDLYNDIISAIEAKEEKPSKYKFGVLDGGKCIKTSSKVVQLDRFRSA